MGERAFEILGIPGNSDETAIRSRFRVLAKEWHPDSNPNPEATEIFGRYKEAYDSALEICKARKHKTNIPYNMNTARKSAYTAGNSRAGTGNYGSSFKSGQSSDWASEMEDIINRYKKETEAKKYARLEETVKQAIAEIRQSMLHEREVKLNAIFEDGIRRKAQLPTLLACEHEIIRHYTAVFFKSRESFIKKLPTDNIIIVNDAYINVFDELLAKERICESRLALMEFRISSKDKNKHYQAIDYYSRMYFDYAVTKSSEFKHALDERKQLGETKRRDISKSGMPSEDEIKAVMQFNIEESLAVADIIQREADRLAGEVVLYDCPHEKENLNALKDRLVDQYADYILFFGKAFERERFEYLMSSHAGLSEPAARIMTMAETSLAKIRLLKKELERLKEDELIPLTSYEQWRIKDIKSDIAELKHFDNV